MDESTHWLLSLIALGLWALAVWAVYFFFIKDQMKELDKMSLEERKKFLETRRQKDERLTRRGL
jgi:hypothetical protein